MEVKELNKILEEHKLWLSGNEEAKRANLSSADLSYARLCGANLSYAELCGANLYGADLCQANFRGADLYGADLSGADLRDANFFGADLRSAGLRDANFFGAKLYGANLYGANLHGAKDVPFIPMLIPDGECIVWKKVRNFIVKLRLLEDSKRSRATTEKCRCDKAIVIDIQNIDGSPSGLSEIENNNFVQTIYKVGEIVCADSWDEDRWNECSHGIHFFIDRQSAVNY